MNIDETLHFLSDRFSDIPFENSDFQNKNFVIASQHTPARAYRAIGLRMFAKINAIKELKFARQLEEVNIAEHQATIEMSGNKFEIARARIKIEQILSGRIYQDKLLNDAIAELACLKEELDKYPVYTRQMFELEEENHFKQRLTQQLQYPSGAAESLLAMENRSKLDKLLLSNDQST